MEISYQLQRFDEGVRTVYERLLPEQTQLIEKGKLEWKLQRCPAGIGLVALASSPEAEHSVIGLNAFQPTRLKIGQKRILAFQSMDTVVDPVARGQGVFTRLIQTFYAAADQHGGAALYGVASRTSAPGFFNKLGWTRLGSAPFLIKPLRAGYFARRLMGRVGSIFDSLPLSIAEVDPDPRIRRIERFGPEVDSLWDAFAAKIPCAVDRTHEMLNWRFADHPAAHYETLAVDSPDGALRAFVTWHLARNKHGGTIGYIMEAMGKPDANLEVARLITAAVAEMRHSGADVVLAWSAPHAPNYKAFRRAGFWPMPDKIRPIELYFGARALMPEATPVVAGAEAWYISYFDSDTV